MMTMAASKLQPADSREGGGCQTHAPGSTLGTAGGSGAALNDKHDKCSRRKPRKATCVDQVET